MSKFNHPTRELRPGDVVMAARRIDPLGADAREGTIGVVFQGDDVDPGFGALVRWLNMGICNVLPSDVWLLTPY